MNQPLALCALLLLMSPSVAAQEDPTITPTVFRRFAGRVVKIQVVELGSGAKARVGSGFFVTDSGHIVTNYHVIAELVHNPDRYRAELVEGTTPVGKLQLLAIDVVHDLAVVRAEGRSPRHFTLGPVTVRQGDRLYALGHPHDLDLSIVEGTHNGLLQHTLDPKVHFTGSLNPGMSGGPTITSAGIVVGVNVSTAGNQVSFLVPVERAIDLVDSVLGPGFEPRTPLIDEVGRQIHAYQNVYLEHLFTGESTVVELGRYRVATQPAPFFRCWGDADLRKELPYERADHQCSTDDNVFIAEDQQSGVVELSHELVTTTALNASRFFALYTSMFQRDNTPGGTEEHVTSWRCGTRNVRNESALMRVVLCLRGYRKLEALYDAVLKVAVLGSRHSGLVSTLTLSGVSTENVDRLTTRYLERIAWR